jgi:hypothetical protein
MPQKEERLQRLGGTRSAADLTVERLPTLDWSGHNDETVDELYRWVEQKAMEAYYWYMAQRVGKARASKMIRILAVALLTVGGILPLLSLILPGVRKCRVGVCCVSLRRRTYLTR